VFYKLNLFNSILNQFNIGNWFVYARVVSLEKIYILTFAIQALILGVIVVLDCGGQAS